MNKNQIFSIIIENKQLVSKYHVSKLGLFGSYVRGQEKKNSDIDLLVEFSTVPDLFEYYNLRMNMENILHKKIDLCTIDSIKPATKESILQEVEWIEGL